MATILAPIGDSSPRSQRRHQACWRKHREPEEKQKHPGNAAENLQWVVGRPEEEARSLYRFMINTKASPKQIADLICVTDAEFEELCQWAAQGPLAIAVRLDQMMEFRQKVSVDNVHSCFQPSEKRPSGNTSSAALRRLRKDRPDLHKKVLAEELSANAIEAGTKKR